VTGSGSGAGRIRQIALPLASRPMVPPLIAAAAAVVIVTTLPSAIFFLETTHGTVARPVSPFEYVPAFLALTLAVQFSPRLLLWEWLGGRRTSLQATAFTLATLASPALVFFCGILAYPADGTPSASALVPLLGNVLALAALSQLAVAYLGRLWGSVGFVLAYYCLVWLQNVLPDVSRYLPLAWNLTASGIDTSWRWHWLLALVPACLLTSWYRKNVPMRTKLAVKGEAA
jgi:hypothetical protein